MVDEKIDGFRFSLVKNGAREHVQDLSTATIAGPYTTETHATTGPVDFSMSCEKGLYTFRIIYTWYTKV